MSIFPLAANFAAARRADAPRARTEDEATTRAGGPVFLAVEELPKPFDTPEAAEAAVPELYGSGIYELHWREGAWRVTMRYWRPRRRRRSRAPAKPPRASRSARPHARGSARAAAHAGGAGAGSAAQLSIWITSN